MACHKEPPFTAEQVEWLEARFCQRPASYIVGSLTPSVIRVGVARAAENAPCSSAADWSDEDARLACLALAEGGDPAVAKIFAEFVYLAPEGGRERRVILLSIAAKSGAWAYDLRNARVIVATAVPLAHFVESGACA